MDERVSSALTALARRPADVRTSLIVLAGYVAVMTIVVVVGQMVFRRRRRAYDAYCLDRGFQLEPRRPGEEARHVTTCPLFAKGRARDWGFTIVGVANGSPFIAFEYEWITGPARLWTDHTIAGILWTLQRDDMPPFFDPVLHVAGAGRELMWWRDGKLPSPKAFDDFLAEGYRVRLRYEPPTCGQ